MHPPREKCIQNNAEQKQQNIRWTVQCAICIKSNAAQKDPDVFELARQQIIDCEENGHEKIYYIEELVRSDDTSLSYDILNERYEVVYASTVYAEFAAINVKSIRFTLEVPEDQASAAIQEVALVGRLKNA